MRRLVVICLNALLGLLLYEGCTKNHQVVQEKDTEVVDTVAVTEQDEEVIETPEGKYELVWHDEFDGNSLDETKWNIDVGNPGSNNEKEYYDPGNVRVLNGDLVLTARKESKAGFAYSSGKISSFGKYHPNYGRIEARIKLPAFQGSWPAFWMLGADFGSVGWPNCGEIDIMEQVNASHDILGTMHWNAGNGHVMYGNKTTAAPLDYHVYAVEWDKEGIRWYVDDVLFNTANITDNVNNTGAFHNPYFMILNLAVGGDLSGPSVNDGALPGSMYVDYVRIYYEATAREKAPIGEVIALRGANGLYVSSENGQKAMNCDRETAGAWENFQLLDAGEGKIALMCMGKYVSSEDGLKPITCNRGTISDWEKFDWELNDEGAILLKGSNGMYVCLGNGTPTLSCTAQTPKLATTFTFE